MATLTSNISSFSMTVSGNTQQSETISWTLPSVPNNAVISSCILTGTATASMSKGSANIKVNGTTVSSGSSFTINLGTVNTTSSVTATVVGNNKNAKGTVTFSNLVYTVNYILNHTVTFVDYDGTILKTETVEDGKSATAPSVPNRSGYEFIGWSVDFSNVTSNITVTAQYKALLLFKIKENNNWTNIVKIYKKVSGVWTEQANEDWDVLFDTNAKYVQKIVQIPTAILYSDGTLVFSNNSDIDGSYGDAVSFYTGWDTVRYISATSAPWYSNKNNIKKVYFNNVDFNSGNYLLSNLDSLERVEGCVSNNVTTMRSMFHGCSNLTSLDLNNFDTSNVTNMYAMFYKCSALTSLDLSSFDTSNVTSMKQMFANCSALTSLDLSSFDMGSVTVTTNMFTNCSNPDLKIYVKDTATKTKIESSSGFPTTATVIVGKPA